MEMEKNKKNRYGFDFTPIGLDIKTFREAQKITREKLAETLDISPRHLQAIELEGKHPSLGLLAYIATIFDMPIDPYIFPEKVDTKSAMRKRLDVICQRPGQGKNGRHGTGMILNESWRHTATEDTRKAHAASICPCCTETLQ